MGVTTSSHTPAHFCTHYSETSPSLLKVSQERGFSLHKPSSSVALLTHRVKPPDLRRRTVGSSPAVHPGFEGVTRMSEAAANQPPASKDAILKVIETERRKLAQWFSSRVREIEMERDGRLAGLDRAGRALDSEPTTAIKPEKRPRSKKAKTAAALAGEKRDAIVRLLGERAEPLALGEIHRALKISEFSTRSALKRLVTEGKIRRLGTGAATRYEAGPSR